MYVLVWFTMVLPSHTRGVVRVPGTDSSVAASCCHSPTPAKDQQKPTKEQEKRCAVCFFGSTISTPIVYVVEMRPIDRIGIAADVATSQVLSAEFPRPYWPTGPPAAL